MKKLSFIILCIFLVGCTSKTYTENLNNGTSEFKEGNYSEAIELFKVAAKEENTNEIDELLSITTILNDSFTALNEGEFEASVFNAKKIDGYKVEEKSNEEIYGLAKSEADRILTEANKAISQKADLDEKIAKGKVLLEQQKFDEAYEIFNALVSKEDYLDSKVINSLLTEAENLAKETTEKKEVHTLAEQKKAEEEKQRKLAAEQAKKAEQKKAQNAKLTKEQAVKLVREQYDIPNKPNLFVEYDHDNEHGDYVIQVYEVVIDDPVTKEGHTATWGWYGVDPIQKLVYDAFDY